jgi:hypothetical protein
VAAAAAVAVAVALRSVAASEKGEEAERRKEEEERSVLSLPPLSCVHVSPHCACESHDCMGVVAGVVQAVPAPHDGAPPPGLAHEDASAFREASETGVVLAQGADDHGCPQDMSKEGFGRRRERREKEERKKREEKENGPLLSFTLSLSVSLSLNNDREREGERERESTFLLCVFLCLFCVVTIEEEDRRERMKRSQLTVYRCE